MKIFQWLVAIKRNSSGFYLPVAPDKFLSGVKLEDAGLSPVFGDSPALYRFRAARFQVSELRRVGYNVSAVPYVIYFIVCWIKARKKRLWR